MEENVYHVSVTFSSKKTLLMGPLGSQNHPESFGEDKNVSTLIGYENRFGFLPN